MLQEGASEENPPPALLLAGEMTGKGVDAGAMKPLESCLHCKSWHFHAFYRIFDHSH